MNSALKALCEDIAKHMCGSSCFISGPWIARSEEPADFEEEVLLEQPEILERTVREVAPGIWANGCVSLMDDGSGYEGIINIRDMTSSPKEVVSFFKSIVRVLSHELSVLDGQTLLPKGMYRHTPFYAMDIYECPISFFRRK
jgi:hypothetical protein